MVAIAIDVCSDHMPVVSGKSFQMEKKPPRTIERWVLASVVLPLHVGRWEVNWVKESAPWATESPPLTALSAIAVT